MPSINEQSEKKKKPRGIIMVPVVPFAFIPTRAASSRETPLNDANAHVLLKGKTTREIGPWDAWLQRTSCAMVLAYVFLMRKSVKSWEMEDGWV
jgi:hypothetical protein